jgi:hypothetical protein
MREDQFLAESMPTKSFRRTKVEFLSNSNWLRFPIMKFQLSDGDKKTGQNSGLFETAGVLTGEKTTFSESECTNTTSELSWTAAGQPSTQNLTGSTSIKLSSVRFDLSLNLNPEFII